MTYLKKFGFEELLRMSLLELRDIGKTIGVKSPTACTKDKLITSILDIQKGVLEPSFSGKHSTPRTSKIDLSRYYEEYPTGSEGEYFKLNDISRADENEKGAVMEGVLIIQDPEMGVIHVKNYKQSKKDVLVSGKLMRRYGLCTGDFVRGRARQIGNIERNRTLTEVITINGLSPSAFADHANFAELTPIYPNERLRLENDVEKTEIAIRGLDLFAPLGLGQRGFVVAPPLSGKTAMMKQIVDSVQNNFPEIKLMVILVDGRPEEINEITKTVSGEVAYSTIEDSYEHQILVAELIFNRAKRLVEIGKSVMVVIDDLSKLVRAYSATVGSGKALSDGIDPLALSSVKRLLGSAKNIEMGGSLTVLSTLSIETGNRADDIVYSELRSVCNMELRLSASSPDRNIFPDIDYVRSGTRNDDLLLKKKEIEATVKLRGLTNAKIYELLKKTENNDELIEKLDDLIKNV